MPLELTAPPAQFQARFLALFNPQDIAELLELSSYSFLKYYLFVLPEGKRYNSFSIPKRNGGQRTILEPVPNLKAIQFKLLQVLQHVYEPKPPVHGFVEHRSIVTNASSHVHQKYVLNLDLKDFFPSIHFGRVRGMFMAYPYNLNDRVATVLAQICSLRNGLPQGAPTSPIISNMLCAKMDSQLKMLAKHNRCHYTRYADDITFSTSTPLFPPSLALFTESDQGSTLQVGVALRDIIEGNGFEINYSKVRLRTRKQRQEVTGLTTNQRVNVDRSYIRRIRAMLHAWETYGYAKAEETFLAKYNRKKPDRAHKKEPTFQRVMKGRIEFLRMVRGSTDRIFIAFNNRAAILEEKDELEPRLFQHIVDPGNDIQLLISKGETEIVEFKLGVCLDPHTNKEEKNMKVKVIRTVAAFLNSVANGTLLLGVTDAGIVIGVEREYATANPSKANWDGYHLFLSNTLKDSLNSAGIYEKYQITNHVVQGKIVACIRTSKAGRPVLIKNQLFVRDGAQSKELFGDEHVNFLMNWSE